MKAITSSVEFLYYYSKSVLFIIIQNLHSMLINFLLRCHATANVIINHPPSIYIYGKINIDDYAVIHECIIGKNKQFVMFSEIIIKNI